MGRLRVGVIYGGRTSEHEVSVASAAAICSRLDLTRYEPVPLFIDKAGRWTVAPRLPAQPAAGAVIADARATAAGGPAANPGTPIAAPDPEVHLVARPAARPLLAISAPAAADAGQAPPAATDTAGRQASPAIDAGQAPPAAAEKAPPAAAGGQAMVVTGLRLDVVFPIVHGPGGEDGTLQGLLELANVPYVGAGVLASAAAMDKTTAKVLLAAHGLPVVAGETVAGLDWERDPDGVVARIEARLAYPLFVKPANLGSSVGVSKAADAAALRAALALAWRFDDRMLVESAVPAAREIECAVLGNEAPEASVPGEVVPAGEFYDYEAKYLDDRSEVIVPARLSAARTADVRARAIDAYRALGCAGMARVDFLLDEAADRLYVNEVNTLPGFTTISQYARLWEATGLPYPALLDRLIALALARHRRRQRLQTSLT